MIARITGVIAGRSATAAVLEVGGIGLRVTMPTRTLARLPADGDLVSLHTHLHVREDELSLFGFETAGEQTLFELLITVSGVGPKVALAVLSTLTPDELAVAIAADDDALIASVPGIGKKTAQRLIIELKDKVGGGASAVIGRVGGGTALAEATDALEAMGFSAAEASLALRGYEGGDGDAQALLRHALKRLGGSV